MQTPAPGSMRLGADTTLSPLVLTAAARCGAEAPLADWGGTWNSPWEPRLGSRARCRVLLAMPPIAAVMVAVLTVHAEAAACDACGVVDTACLAGRDTGTREYFCLFTASSFFQCSYWRCARIAPRCK